MVNEYEQAHPSGKYQMHEQVDILDEKGQWLNGEIIEISGKQLKIRYSGYSSKFDTWIAEDSPRLLKQWRFGSVFQINNRIDVIDTYSMWKEARIIDQNETQIKIHYRGYADKYDEWIHKTSSRISEIGSKSKAYGVGRYDPNNNCRHSQKEAVVEGEKFELISDREQRFSHLLNIKSLRIFPVNGDGNCLFRSVSHQIYTDDSFHHIIRETAMRYISLEREYFSQFIIGGLDKIDEYIYEKSKSGSWGDDIEIQAMSEIYNKPFNIFVYSNTPIRTFHEDHGQGRPIRLAYHGSCHYNSIIEIDKHEKLISTVPGEYENHVLQIAQSEEFKVSLLRYRQEFEQIMQSDIEEALRLSLESLDGDDVMLRQAIEMSIKTEESKEMGMNEEEMLRCAIEMSQDENDLLQHAIEISKSDAVPDAVIFVMNSGFTLEQAMEAWHLVGDDPDRMMEYIFSCIL